MRHHEYLGRRQPAGFHHPCPVRRCYQPREDGDSSYNPLQATLRTRFSRGLQFQGAYTFGRVFTDDAGLTDTSGTHATVNSTDPNNRAQQHAEADFNRTHRLVARPQYPDRPNFDAAVIKKATVGSLHENAYLNFAPNLTTGKSPQIAKPASNAGRPPPTA